MIGSYNFKLKIEYNGPDGYMTIYIHNSYYIHRE